MDSWLRGLLLLVVVWAESSVGLGRTLAPSNGARRSSRWKPFQPNPHHLHIDTMQSASPSSSTLPFISLPYLDVQPDYAQVLSDVSRSVVRSESYWLSAYKGPDSVHGKVRSSIHFSTRDKSNRLIFRCDSSYSAVNQVSCERDEDGDLKTKGVEGIVLTRTSSSDDVRSSLTFCLSWSSFVPAKLISLLRTLLGSCRHQSRLPQDRDSAYSDPRCPPASDSDIPP